MSNHDMLHADDTPFEKHLFIFKIPEVYATYLSNSLSDFEQSIILSQIT